METGWKFEITNSGAGRVDSSPYTLTLDDTAPVSTAEPQIDATDEVAPVTEFTLQSGESLSLDAGFGRPSLTIGEIVYQSDTPCDPPPTPVLAVSAVCTLEKGVTFTVTNSGGAMKDAQSLSIAVSSGDPITSTFLLGTNEQASFDAGYGQPTFTSDGLTSTVDTSCDVPATISGTVWNDADGDGTRGAAETGIAGVSVNLIDAAGAVQTSVTGADGTYGFATLPVGGYTVRVDASTFSTDYTLTSPADGKADFNAESGGTYIADFGYVGTPTASVTGTVWLDSSNYGVRDAGETGIAGVMVDLVDRSGVTVAVAPVDAATGTYTFNAVLAGGYTVRLDQTTLFTPNAVSYNSDDTLDYETPITLTTDQALTGIDFGVAGTF